MLALTRPTFGEAMTDAPARNAAREAHPWIQADVQRIHNAILSALAGQPAQLQDIYDDILDRDDRVSSCVRTRCIALVGKPWAIKPPPGFEDDADAKRIAAELQDIIGGIHRWPLIVGELAAGITRGYAVQETMWGVDRKGRYVPKDLLWRAENRFVFQPGTMAVARRDLGDPYTGVALDELAPDKFVVHAPTAGRASYITRGGVMISILVPALVKRFGLTGWLKGLERSGVPLPILNLGDAKDAGDTTSNNGLVETGKQILRDMTADWGAVVWGGMTFEKMAGSGEFDGLAQEKIVNLANTSIAITVLGQNLSTEVVGGSFAAAKEANVVRGDLLANDLIELGATVREQLLERIVRFNWPGAPVSVYETQVGGKQAPTVDEVNAGLYTPDEARSGKGWAPMPDGKGAEHRPAMVTVPATIGAPSLVPVAGDAAPVAESALNGAQIAEMRGIVESVTAGKIPRDSGVAQLMKALSVDLAEAERLMGSAGKGFVPAAPDAPTASPGGAPAVPPFRAARAAPPLTVAPTMQRRQS